MNQKRVLVCLSCCRLSVSGGRLGIYLKESGFEPGVPRHAPDQDKPIELSLSLRLIGLN